MKSKIQLLVAFLLLTFSINSLNAQNTSGIHLVNKTILGGEGGWDYLHVDNQNQKIYLSHSTQVEVVDLNTHKSVAVIKDTPGVHGILALPELNKGLTTNGKSNTTTLFDLKTWKTIITLPTGEKPDALLYDTFSSSVFIFNNEGSSTTVIDPKSNKVIGTIELGGAPEAGVADGKGTVYVNLEDTNEIVAFNSKSLKVTKRFKLAPGETPTGLALDKETNRLFSVCRNQLMIVLDADKGNIIAQLPIGKGCDGLVFDPTTKTAISSNGEGTMTIVKEISANEFKVIDTITTAPGARTITMDARHHLFLTTAQLGDTPAPTKEVPNPRPAIVPGTFMLLEFSKK